VAPRGLLGVSRGQRDKERANFCDHFRPVAGAFKGGTTGAADAARAELEKLFGK
jgi:hypothetical protein